MADVEFDLIFNSGVAENRYVKGDNVSLIEITNSDQDYYQTGVVTLFDVDNLQTVGDTVLIRINHENQFYGYVARRQQEIVGGKKHSTYQLVGKTYDLWRYHTTEKDTYTGYTGRIAYDLISSNCPGISGNDITLTDGVELLNEIDLTNIPVGDAIVKLTEYDGFKFYVDNDDELQYYEPEERLYDFTVTEDDIVEMSAVEEADEDIINDVLVVGGSDYSKKDTIATSYPSSTVFPSGIIVGQRFIAKDHTLSAIKFYLNRSTDPTPPGALTFEIWENTAQGLFDDNFDNENHIADHFNTRILSSYLELDTNQEGIEILDHNPIGFNQSFTGKMVAQSFVADLNGTVTSIHLSQGVQINNEGYYEVTIMRGSDPSSGPLVCRSEQMYASPGHINLTFPVRGNHPMKAGETYVWELRRVADQGGTDNDQNVKALSNDTSEQYANPDYADGSLWMYNVAGHPDWWNVPDNDEGGSWIIKGNSYNTNGITSSQTYVMEDALYLKIELSDLTSSNNITISGTNDDGVNWKKMVDGSWIKFDSASSDGCRLVYYFTSNGDFAPSIGRCVLRASDDSGGMEDEVFNDLYDNKDILALNTDYDKVTLTSPTYGDGILCLSSSADYKMHFIDTVIDYDDWNPNLATAIKNDNDISVYSDFQESNMQQLILEFSTPKHLDAVKTATFAFRAGFQLNDIFVSGPGYSDWEPAITGATYNLAFGDEEAQTFEFDNNYVWSGVKRIRVDLSCIRYYGSPDVRINYIKFREIVPPTQSAVISSNTYIISDTNFSHLKVEPTVAANSDLITYSGSLTGGGNGSDWTKLEPDTNTLMGTAGISASVMIYMRTGSDSWGGNKYDGEVHPATPRIESCKLTASYTLGGGKPKSGSRVEWSNDFTFTTADLSYPPDWTEWKEWSAPKLSGLIVDREYWLILYHNSTNSAYWQYYYDPNDTYNGKISYTWNGSENYKTNWSSNAQLPAVVPAGNMSFQLGWTQGDIAATATNEDSITSYGRHFKKITDSTITTQDAAQARADAAVLGMEYVPKKGSMTIDGRTTMRTYYRFSSNLTNFGIDDIWDVVSYTQRIDENGFTTEINYGKQPFDITKIIAELQNKVEE